MKTNNKNLLYPIRHTVPMSVIKKAYEGNLRAKFYRPPLTGKAFIDLWNQTIRRINEETKRKESGNDKV